jgi:hypothetical protein
MKSSILKIRTTILFCSVIGIIGVWAQSPSFPSGFNFQAVLRSQTGELLNSKNCNLRVSITSDIEGNTVLYSEIHTKTSSIYGALSIVVGQGVVQTGTFATIDWAGGLRYVKVEYKELGQSVYELFSITQLMAVPYALNALTVQKENDPAFTASVSAGITAKDTALWNAKSKQIYSDSNPVGTIIYFAGSTPPTGYLVCDGSLLSRAKYPALLAAIGVTYGMGDGLTTFPIPDLRGEFIRGYDNGRGLDSGRSFGSHQASGVPNITGTISGGPTYNNNTCGGAFYNNGSVWGQDKGGDNNGSWYYGFDASRSSTEYQSISEVRPRNIALLPCIKY